MHRIATLPFVRWPTKIDDAMLKALAAYRGPVKHCGSGTAYGATDLHTWAQRRATGKSGVPDAQVMKRVKKAAKRRAKLYRRYTESGASHRISFQQWLRNR